MSERVFQLMNVVLIGTVVAFLWAAYYAVKAVLDALEKEDAAEHHVQRTAPKAGDEITAEDEAPYFEDEHL